MPRKIKTRKRVNESLNNSRKKYKGGARESENVANNNSSPTKKNNRGALEKVETGVANLGKGTKNLLALPGKKGAELVEGSVSTVGNLAGKTSKGISKITKSGLGVAEKVTEKVGIDRGTLAGTFTDDANCKFDVAAKSEKQAQIESKGESDVKNRLSQSSLFGNDDNLKKFMDERLVKKCSEYHNTQINVPDTHFMRFFNHCNNLFDCYKSLDETVYIFNDVIGSDVLFLDEKEKEEKETKTKKQIEEKLDKRKKEADEKQKEIEEKIELEKQIGESKEETEKRQASEKKKKQEKEKYLKENEKKLEKIEKSSEDLKKQLETLLDLFSKEVKNRDSKDKKKESEAQVLKGELEKIKQDAYTRNKSIIELVLKNKTYTNEFDNLRNEYSKQESARGYKRIERPKQFNKKVEDFIKNRIFVDIKTNLENNLNKDIGDLQKKIDTDKNEKVIKEAKGKILELKMTKFFIKYGFTLSEKDNLLGEEKGKDALPNLFNYLKKAFNAEESSLKKKRVVVVKQIHNRHHKQIHKQIHKMFQITKTRNSLMKQMLKKKNKKSLLKKVKIIHLRENPHLLRKINQKKMK